MKLLTPKFATVVVSVLSLSASSSAAFVGVISEFAGEVDGRRVYKVFAVSNTGSDVLLAAFNHQVTSGSMASVEHNDEHGGTWAPHVQSLSASASDSFVSITGHLGTNSGDNSVGVGTVLTTGWVNGGSGEVIANGASNSGASWQSSNPQMEIRADSGAVVGGMYRILIMQVAGAQLGTAGNQYSAKLSIAYRATGATSPSYTMYQAFSIPAPGMVAVALIAGAAVRGRPRSER
jgi:acetyl-CoA carboxylase carboxyltransferase component